VGEAVAEGNDGEGGDPPVALPAEPSGDTWTLSAF
jgi:hypothetical protein